jgi:hypothetical protein
MSTYQYVLDGMTDRAADALEIALSGAREHDGCKCVRVRTRLSHAAQKLQVKVWAARDSNPEPTD